MNQGNRDEHWHDNGIWSDGGLIFQWPSGIDRWSAIFLAFQTQSWHTDDRGNPIPYPDQRRSGDRQSGDEDRTPPPASSAPLCIPTTRSGVSSTSRSEMTATNHCSVGGWRLLNRDGDAIDSGRRRAATRCSPVRPSSRCSALEQRRPDPLARRRRRRSGRGFLHAPRGAAQARVTHLLRPAVQRWREPIVLIRPATLDKSLYSSYRRPCPTADT